MTTPVFLRWDGEAFWPATKRQAALCDEQFVVGEVHQVQEVHLRSTASHAHYFAVLTEIFNSLPDALASQYPNVETLRHYALIRTGFCTMKQYPCNSVSEAERLASVIKGFVEYEIIDVQGSVVTVYTAQSQSNKAMDKETFGRSKTAVLEWCAALIGAEVP